MPLYMVQAAYTAEACAALSKNPEARSLAVRALLEKIGGKIISFYFCLGKYDVVLIYEAPDETTAAAIALAVVSSGHIKSFETTTLLTVDKAMTAMRKAGSVTYKPPSG